MTKKNQRILNFFLIMISFSIFDIVSKRMVFDHFSVVIADSAQEVAKNPQLGVMQELSPGVFVPYPYQPIEVIPSFFNLHVVLNRGAVWGIMQGQTILLTLVAIGALVFILYALFTKPEMQTFWFPFALIAAGAIGNLWDRILFSGVRDFLDFYIGEQLAESFILFEWLRAAFVAVNGSAHWPTFNFADVFIVVGILSFILMEVILPLFGFSREEKGNAPTQSPK